MKKFTLLLALLFTTTMSIFAQDATEETSTLRLVSTYPSTTEEIENIGSIDFTFSEKVIVVTDVVKCLEIKNEANEVVAEVSLENVAYWENTVYPSILPIDTIWNEYTDEKTGEINKYPEYVYPDLSIPGTYTLTIPAGVFVSAQDNTITLEETTLTFKVIGRQPAWWTDYDYTTTTREFEKITIYFDNTESVALNDGVVPMLYSDGGAEYTGSLELITEVDDKDGKTTTKIEITFGEKFTSVDTYYVMIPAGMFTMNDAVSNLEKMLTFAISAPIEVTPLEITGITPTVGEVGQIESIIITYNQNIGFAYDENWQVISRDINLVDADGNVIILSQTGNYYIGLNQIEYAYLGETPEMNEYWFYKPVAITAAGTYTLDASQIIVGYGYDAASYTYNAQGSAEGTFTWTIGDTAIDGIEADAENAEIHDITGRRVENITKAGIYIVGGKKVLVK